MNDYWQGLGLFLLFVGWSTLVWITIMTSRYRWALALLVGMIVVLNIAPVVVPD